MIIVGAGIVGLSTALEIKNRNPTIKVAIIEKEETFARHQSGNNSGVIHTGIYYKPGSEKAKNCLNGYSKLIDFCDEFDVEYKICGKLIVAKNESEISNLCEIWDKGVKKGMKNISMIAQSDISQIEPHINGFKAIHVPDAGIIDYKSVCQKIEYLLIQKGVTFFYGNKVIGINIGSDVIVKTSKQKFSCSNLILCGGLYSDKLVKMTGLNPSYKILPFRGEYYQLKKDLNKLINGLIYPVPDPQFPFLGIHLTKKMDNSIEAGPNAVLAFRREGYSFKDIHLGEFAETLMFKGFRKLASRYTSIGINEIKRSISKKTFLRELKSFLPELKMSDINYRGAGVRAQACDKDGNLIDDFLILKEGPVVNVCNAPSPAATSCFSISESIVRDYLVLD